MPTYTIPNFNLTCAIIQRPSDPGATLPILFLGNLAFGKRVNQPSSIIGGSQGQPMYLLCPKLTDIRGQNNGGHDRDTVEIPYGSGRQYTVEYTEDIGKGFPNEHRVAIVVMFTSPYPMP